jgi:hypothetical protein
VGYFSAGAAPAPFGGDVILLSSGLLYLRFWLAWMSILLKPSQEPETAKDLLLHALPDLAMQILAFRPFAKFTLFLEMANRRTDVMLGEELQNRAWLAESFIILHEFGHIALGHTDQVRNWKPGHLLTTKQLAQRRSLQRQWELEADGFAAEALGGITPVEDMAAAFDAVFQLFRCREEFECKSSDVDTHPTARQRHTQVMARFLDLKPEEVVQFSDHLELLRGGIDAHRRQRRHES